MDRGHLAGNGPEVAKRGQNTIKLVSPEPLIVHRRLTPQNYRKNHISRGGSEYNNLILTGKAPKMNLDFSDKGKISHFGI